MPLMLLCSCAAQQDNMDAQNVEQETYTLTEIADGYGILTSKSKIYTMKVPENADIMDFENEYAPSENKETNITTPQWSAIITQKYQEPTI